MRDFFHLVEPISLQDPLAEFLGATSPEERLVYTYADAVRLCGHSCPAVAGGFMMAKKALVFLFGKEVPQRGSVRVTFRGDVSFRANGPISQVVGLVTGAAGENGFHGLVGGRFRREGLLLFDQNSFPQGTAQALFERMDNRKKVEVTYNPGIVPVPEEMNLLLEKLGRGMASPDEARRFGDLWQERVKRILLDPPDGVFVLKEG